jgi:hypothetical protein
VDPHLRSVQVGVLGPKRLRLEREDERGIEVVRACARGEIVCEVEIGFAHLLDEACPQDHRSIERQGQSLASRAALVDVREGTARDSPRDTGKGVIRHAELAETAFESRRQRDDSDSPETVAKPEKRVVEAAATSLISDRGDGYPGAVPACHACQ